MSQRGTRKSPKTSSTELNVAKGCVNCERRRIRCDLRQPACFKCCKKGLECLGYNRPLRWVNGVAARGHLRGRSVPAKSVPPESSQEARCGPPSPPREPRDMVSECGTRVVGSSRPAVDLGADNPGAPPNLMNSSVPSTCFMDYYRRNLAGLMVWLDSEENDYRKRVIPLAEKQPAIGFAIVAFAAQHGAVTFPYENIATLAESARDRCLQLIQCRAQEMTQKVIQGLELNTHSDIADAEWMLASILIIGNYENARCCPGVADGHRRAARTIVNLFSHSVSAEGSELFAFLRNQLAIEDVLAATTSFDPSLIQNAITPVPGSDCLLFSKYLTVLHRVTLNATNPSQVASRADSAEPGLTLAVVQSEFEQARGATLMAAGRLGLGSSRMTRDFIRIVEAYHNAGILYSFRCLDLSDENSAEWLAAANKLFGQLTGFEDQTMVVQNLPWPAFVAGTVCHGVKERQQAVLNFFDAIHQATKFNHYLDAADFLKSFWAGQVSDWRPLARSREAAGHRIIVV